MAAAAIAVGGLIINSVALYAPKIATYGDAVLKQLEAHFPPQSGTEKRLIWLDNVVKFVAGLSTAGVVQAPPPTNDQLLGMLEGLLGAAKADGTLPVAGSAIQVPVPGSATVAVPVVPVVSGVSTLLQSMETTVSVFSTLIAQSKGVANA